jgi:uncharacterized protein (TIGR03067 family)
MAAPAAVPAALLSATIRSATLVAARQALTDDALSPTVSALMQGVLKVMWSKKLQKVVGVLVAVVLVAVGGGLLARQGAAHQDKAEKPAPRAGGGGAEARKKKAEAIARERKKFEGTWALIRIEGGGEKLTAINKEIVRPKVIAHAQNLGARIPDTAGVKLVVVYDSAGKWKERTHGRNLKMPRMEGEKVVFDHDLLFSEGTSTIDPTGNPKTMDQANVRQLARGVSFAHATRGIYEWVNKDTWRVCFGPPGQGRPAGFAGKPGDGRRCWVFERVKPKD